MKNMILRYSNIFAFVLGAISVLGFAPWFWIVTDFVAFSVLFYILLNSTTVKHLFVRSYWFGFAHFAFGFSWIGNALLIDVKQLGWLYPITLVALGAFFGLFFAFPALFVMWGQKRWQKWIIFGSAIVVFEWLRSFLFTGFPWNLLGYTFAFSDELIQGASVGGTYLLSLFAILLYTVGGLWLQKTDIKSGIYISSGIVFLFCVLFFWGSWRLGANQLKETDVVVRIVQPSIPQTLKWNRMMMEENFSEYVRMSDINTSVIPSFIIWGETASPFMLDRDDYHLQQILPVLKKGSYLVAGMISYQDTTEGVLPHNSMVLFNPEGKVVDYYHKSHLVPFGEYIPFRKYLPNFIRPIANMIGTFGKGNGPKIIKIDGLPSLGGVICYEIIFPKEIVDSKNKPEFLVNLTNDGWYGDSAGPHQHWVATKMRAVEEGIAVIRAANNGISGMIDALGREKALMKLNYKGVLDVKLNDGLVYNTLYSRFGNVLILTFCLILLFLGFIKIRA